MRFGGAIDRSTGARSWVVWLLAIGLTLLLFLSIGLSAGSVRPGDLLLRAMLPRQPIQQERLAFETVPQHTPGVSRVAPRTAPRTTPSARPAPRQAVPALVVPPSRTSARSDSGRSAAGQSRAQQPSASTPTGLAPPDARLTAPDARFAPPAEPLASPDRSAPASGVNATPPCSAPCVAGSRAGIATALRTLTPAERDSVLRALAASVPYLANRPNDSAGRAGDCAGCAGIPAPPSPSRMPTPLSTGIAIPLPGGGPSRAQRTRDSTVNAHVLPILARLKQRADSVLAARRRDSLAAAAKHRRDSLDAGGRQRQDSTSGTRPWRMSSP